MINVMITLQHSILVLRDVLHRLKLNDTLLINISNINNQINAVKCEINM